MPPSAHITRYRDGATRCLSANVRGSRWGKLETKSARKDSRGFHLFIFFASIITDWLKNLHLTHLFYREAAWDRCNWDCKWNKKNRSGWIMEETFIATPPTSRQFSTKYRMVSRENLSFEKLQNLKVMCTLFSALSERKGKVFPALRSFLRLSMPYLNAYSWWKLHYRLQGPEESGEGRCIKKKKKPDPCRPPVLCPDPRLLPGQDQIEDRSPNIQTKTHHDKIPILSRQSEDTFTWFFFFLMSWSDPPSKKCSWQPAVFP